VTPARWWALAAAAVAAIALAIVLPLAPGGDGDDPPPRAATATAPAAGASATTPATPDTGVATIPDGVPGYDVSPVPIGTARESLVFRTRNAILNGLAGAPSGYALEIAQATRDERTALLVGVAARPGFAQPGIPEDIARLIGGPPETRRSVAGRGVAVYRTPDYRLVVVEGGPGRAVVAIDTARAPAVALGSAVARGIAAEGD
jgi:hypothetical protein